MPLCDDLKLPVTDEELGRRKFLGLVGSGALGAAALGTAITAVRYLEPSVLYEEDSRFVIGRPEDIAIGTVVVLAKQKVYVVRTKEGYIALSSTCTHLGCMTRHEEGGFACPCHGSRFALDGTVTGGPAPRPLPLLELVIDRGQLVVDAARPGALLKVA